MTLTPAALAFAGDQTGGTLNPLTSSQTVTVDFNGPGSIGWTATANQPWVQITGGTGAGSGIFSVGIVNPSNVLAGATSVSATVSVTAANTQNSPRTIAVNLTLIPAAAGQAAFGQVDTPVQNANGVVGAIGVTGWALDDVGVSSVKIYRNCLPFEDQANCQTMGGQQRGVHRRCRLRGRRAARCGGGVLHVSPGISRRDGAICCSPTCCRTCRTA